MSDLVIPAPAPTILPVEGGGSFPVRRIYCVGRNYADHAREMGSDPDREPPFFFAKPRDAAICADRIAYPPATRDLHHEVELVLALGAGGHDLSPEAAEALVFGSAVGVDLTRRDLQAEAKRQGRPWTTAKGFDQSAPVGLISRGLPSMDAAISLMVNGQTRQASTLNAMIWPVGDILAALSRLFALAAGDLVFTGTPAGVGALAKGDTLEARIEGLAPCRFTVG